MFATIPGYQRAVVRSTQRIGHAPRRPDLPARYTVHFTVGKRFYDYSWPPQFSVGWGGGHGLPVGSKWDLGRYYDLAQLTGPRYITITEGTVYRLQHCPVTNTGSALLGGAWETNNAGLVNIQCEFIANPAEAPDFYDWEYEILANAIAEQIQGARDAFGDQSLIDPTNMPEFLGSVAYGTGSRTRMSGPDWYAFDGICGHQNVTGNDHWDPGDLDSKRLSALVTSRLEGATMEERLAYLEAETLRQRKVIKQHTLRIQRFALRLHRMSEAIDEANQSTDPTAAFTTFAALAADLTEAAADLTHDDDLATT